MWLFEGPLRLLLVMVLAPTGMFALSQFRYEEQPTAYALFLLAASALALVTTAGIAKYRVLHRPPSEFQVNERGLRITRWLLLLLSATGLLCALINQVGYRGFSGFASATERR